jgi:hypothetical protein
MGAVSYVSCVSCVYWMNAVETHETIHSESGMRYQVSSSGPDLSSDRASLLTADRRQHPYRPNEAFGAVVAYRIAVGSAMGRSEPAPTHADTGVSRG